MKLFNVDLYSAHLLAQNKLCCWKLIRILRSLGILLLLMLMIMIMISNLGLCRIFFLFLKRRQIDIFRPKMCPSCVQFCPHAPYWGAVRTTLLRMSQTGENDSQAGWLRAFVSRMDFVPALGQ